MFAGLAVKDTGIEVAAHLKTLFILRNGILKKLLQFKIPFFNIVKVFFYGN